MRMLHFLCFLFRCFVFPEGILEELVLIFIWLGQAKQIHKLSYPQEMSHNTVKCTTLECALSEDSDFRFTGKAQLATEIRSTLTF